MKRIQFFHFQFYHGRHFKAADDIIFETNIFSVFSFIFSVSAIVRAWVSFVTDEFVTILKLDKINRFLQ